MSVNKNNHIYESLIMVLAVLLTAIPIFTQSGGPYFIERSVISNGGVTNVAGGQFAVAGTIGQSAAGQAIANPTASVHSGFWTPMVMDLSPVRISISGHVTTPSGAGLRNATVTITDPVGVIRKATTSSFGFYQFDNVDPGLVYVIAVSSKRYRFTASILLVSDSLASLDFVGQQ